MLTEEEIMKKYGEVIDIYPHIKSLNHKLIAVGLQKAFLISLGTMDEANWKTYLKELKEDKR